MGNKHPTYCPFPPQASTKPCFDNQVIQLNQQSSIVPSSYFTYNPVSKIATFQEFVAAGLQVPVVSCTISNNGSTAANDVLGTLSSVISALSNTVNGQSYPTQYWVNNVAVPTGQPIVCQVGDVVELVVTGPIPKYATLDLQDNMSWIWTSNSSVLYCNTGTLFLQPVDKSTPNAIVSKRC